MNDCVYFDRSTGHLWAADSRKETYASREPRREWPFASSQAQANWLWLWWWGN